MSSRENKSQGVTGHQRGRKLIARLVDVGSEHVESLSWHLGNRVTVEADAERRFELAHRHSRRTVTAFEVTDYTCVLRLRTPIGREKFYGVANADVSSRFDDEWVRTC
ncbi:hypothetical protein [Natrinema halophilum]|uniref:Uncharacterized protein n=1 Tax=Natrinema halophilum TaxID=1699371 RepID=A0A7D5L352_9EURY|nr:hypothetical protein [Natrinema halophilum]QLG47485.1 hypothetical protein HYG82_00795 [Natrinema halophilum]